jgi:hypothetical protein
MRAVSLLFLLLASAAAQGPVDVINSRTLQAEVTFLSANSLAGRKTGSNEAHITGDYIAAQFQQLGLKPAGSSGSFFQNYDLVVGAEDDDNMALTARFSGLEKNYQINHDYDLFWITQTVTPAIASAPLVFLGYGINAPEYGYNDFASVDVRGKIAVIIAHEPQESDPRSLFKGRWHTYHAYDWIKYQELQKAGAAGILEVHESHNHRPAPASSAPRVDWFPNATYSLPGLWDLPVFGITEEVANELLKASSKTIAILQSEIDRDGKPQSFEVPGGGVTLRRSFKDRHVVQARNVIGILEGADPKLKDEYIIVSAHYDHLGVVNGRVQPGADDNASGVAGLLEIARAFVEGGVRPRRSVLFVAFDSEEAGLLGAFHYAGHPVLPLGKAVANLNMDMIGSNEDTPTWHLFPDYAKRSVNVVGTLYSPELRRIIEKQNESVGLALDFKTDADDREEWFARSDHFVFATHGIPAVLFNTGEHPDYHTENDTADKLNYPKLEKIVRLVFATSVQLANSESKPRFDVSAAPKEQR